MTIIRTVEGLNALYGVASEASLVKVTRVLTPEYRQMIEAAPFAALATVGPEGLDCSPRGDDGCVVRIADGRTVLMPDWRGNTRVDSLANIVRDPRRFDVSGPRFEYDDADQRNGGGERRSGSLAILRRRWPESA